jgi:hypothetical protein
MNELTTSIAEWRASLEGNPAVTSDDLDELQSHLEDQIDELQSVGLSPEEAFLIASRRLGADARLAGQYEREHSERRWGQLELPTATDTRSGVWTMVAFATASAALTLALFLVGQYLDASNTLFVRNAGAASFVAVAAYLVLVRRVPARRVLPVLAVGAGFIVVTNLYALTIVADGLQPWADWVLLVAANLPVVLWGLIAVLYLHDAEGARPGIEFVRFTGEWVIYLMLLVLGGGAFVALASLLIIPVTGFDALPGWLMSAGLGGAVIVATWLVEAKRRALENIAPVLAAAFTPLLAALAVVAAVVYLTGDLLRNFDRDVLLAFDLLLLAVFAVVVFGVSVRGSSPRPTIGDHIRTVAVLAAVLLDVLVLVSMLTRIGELGLTPNRTAGLGLNLILVVSLAVTGWLSVRMAFGHATPAAVQRWQVRTLPVLAGWAAVVCVAIPPLFGFR